MLKIVSRMSLIPSFEYSDQQVHDQQLCGFTTLRMYSFTTNNMSRSLIMRQNHQLNNYNIYKNRLIDIFDSFFQYDYILPLFYI